MNSESSSSQIYRQTTDDSPSAKFSVPAATNVPDYLQPEVPTGNEDDLAFAKAQTLMLGQELDELPPPADFHRLRETRSRYYIQGVVQGQRAYIITNLLSGESKTFFQPQMIWTIGRNREAALPLRDRVLSRRHAVILWVPKDGFCLIDLNSMNGSYVNGKRIQQRLSLKDGDRLRLGNVEFSFFTSGTARTIDPIHPEVLARFTSPKTRAENFIDYAALEEPEILFGTTQE